MHNTSGIRVLKFVIQTTTEQQRMYYNVYIMGWYVQQSTSVQTIKQQTAIISDYISRIVIITREIIIIIIILSRSQCNNQAAPFPLKIGFSWNIIHEINIYTLVVKSEQSFYYSQRCITKFIISRP